METLRQSQSERKPLTVESLRWDTGYPLRKGGTTYLQWLLTRDDLHDTLRTAIHAELDRRRVKR